MNFFVGENSKWKLTRPPLIGEVFYQKPLAPCLFLVFPQQKGSWGC